MVAEISGTKLRHYHPIVQYTRQSRRCWKTAIRMSTAVEWEAHVARRCHAPCALTFVTFVIFSLYNNINNANGSAYMISNKYRDLVIHVVRTMTAIDRTDAR